MEKLVVECNENAVGIDTLFKTSSIMITPPITEDYWLFKVKLSPKQAIVCFPKFGTIGIGFQKEADWNTNLPYTSGTDEIYNHIKHNKGSKKITDGDCLKAIGMLQSVCAELKSASGKIHFIGRRNERI